MKQHIYLLNTFFKTVENLDHEQDNFVGSVEETDEHSASVQALSLKCEE